MSFVKIFKNVNINEEEYGFDRGYKVRCDDNGNLYIVILLYKLETAQRWGILTASLDFTPEILYLNKIQKDGNYVKRVKEKLLSQLRK